MVQTNWGQVKGGLVRSKQIGEKGVFYARLRQIKLEKQQRKAAIL